VFVELYKVDGYIQAWWVGFALALVGLAAAIVLRPKNLAEEDAISATAPSENG